MHDETPRQTADTGFVVSETDAAQASTNQAHPVRIPYLLTLPFEQIKEILNRHAERIPTCELCGKRFRRKEDWQTGAWQVDAKNNPDTLYIYRMHLCCYQRLRSDPQQRELLAIEARATHEFTEYLRSLPTAGGVQ